MDKITRKELKTDKFAKEVGHTVTYVSEHRKLFVGAASAAVVVLVLVLGFLYYQRQQKSARQTDLRAAMEIQEANIGTPMNEYMISFPTKEAKDQAADKAFGELMRKHAGTEEAYIAQYYLGVRAADSGKFAEAEKHLKAVADSGGEFASLAKFSLAQIHISNGNATEAEKLLRSLQENPTMLVSKEQATISLAEVIGKTKPDEARKLLEPLRTERGAVSRAAITALSQLPR